MTQDKYFASTEQEEIELERLRLLHQIFDPLTIENIENIGISEGWTCLEVGAGAGSIASWMSDRVSLSGKVLATDIEMKFLSQLNKSNLEIRKHNIVNDDIEENSYDLVHCRFLLMHLNEYKKALNKMSSALKPGGWLLIEELDYTTYAANDDNDPGVVFINNYNKQRSDLLKKKGIVDPYFGRHVRSIIDGLGLINVGSKGVTDTYRGGETYARWNLATGRTAYQRNLEENEDTFKAREYAILMNTDSSFYWTAPTFFSAWGRKLK